MPNVVLPVWLDGCPYNADMANLSHQVNKIASLRRSLTYNLLRQEANAFEHIYNYTLVCTPADLAQLRTSYRKASTATNKLDLVDAEDFEWNPATGSDDERHAYATGVYFTKMGAPIPKSEINWASDAQLFAVPIELVAITKAMPTTLYYAILDKDGRAILTMSRQILCQGNR